MATVTRPLGETVTRPLGATVIRPLGATVIRGMSNQSPEDWNPFPATGGFGLKPSIDSELKYRLRLQGIDVKDSVTYNYLDELKKFEITNVDGIPQSGIYISLTGGRKKRSIKRKGNKKKNKRTHSRKYKYK